MQSQYYDSDASLAFSADEYDTFGAGVYPNAIVEATTAVEPKRNTRLTRRSLKRSADSPLDIIIESEVANPFMRLSACLTTSETTSPPNA